MRPDRPCERYDDLSDRERHQCWAIAAIGIVVLFALAIAAAGLAVGRARRAIA